jgi:hypothetical protein
VCTCRQHPVGVPYATDGAHVLVTGRLPELPPHRQRWGTDRRARVYQQGIVDHSAVECFFTWSAISNNQARKQRVGIRAPSKLLANCQHTDRHMRVVLWLQVYVAVGDVLLGGLGFRDVLRPDASDTVSALQALGLRVFLLSGDDTATVQVGFPASSLLCLTTVAEAAGVSCKPCARLSDSRPWWISRTCPATGHVWCLQGNCCLGVCHPAYVSVLTGNGCRGRHPRC